MYHTQLNKGQSNLLERVQKRCLRVIYGYSKSYAELLLLSGLEMLSYRRQKKFEKFATKTSENIKYSSWFPPHNTGRTTRNKKTYLEETALTSRLYKSPLFAMRRYLNTKTPDEPDPEDLTGINNAP